MRITQSMMTRNYLKGLGSNLKNVAGSNSRLASGRRFTKISEDTAGATRAFTVRERLYRSESFSETIKGAAGELSSAENNLSSINKIIVMVKEKAQKGSTGSASAESREILAREVTNLKEQVLQLANSKFGDKYLFGGSNNSSAAFGEVNGKMTFQGIPVESMRKVPDGTYFYTNANGIDAPVPQMKNRYIDIGLGMTMTDEFVDEKSAFKINTNGLDALGVGTDNLYNLLGEVEDALRNNDPRALDPMLDKLTAQSDKMLMSITDIGSKNNFLDQMSERFADDILTLQEEQKSIELINIEQESIYNSSYYATWMTTLKLGNKLIPPSLFDFMN